MKLRILCILLVVLSLAGCPDRKSGPLERAGESVDEAIDNVSEGQSPLHKKGPLEKAGESVDEAFDSDK